MDQNREAKREKVDPKNGAAKNGASEAEQAEQGGEFKIYVKKLDLPVRPRGVLAE